MYLLVKQAFAIRFPNEALIENLVVHPQVSATSTCRQPLDGAQLPSATDLEQLIQENVSLLII